MANIKVIAEHSVDVDLLTGGICIDVGCRGFQFSEAMRDLGCHVLAFDMEKMDEPNGVSFFHMAVSNYSGAGKFHNTKDQQAKHLVQSGDGVTVGVVDINEVYNLVNNLDKEFDVLKLDCESSEYFILSDTHFQPIPRQISIEFHMHAHRALHDQYYNKCMENLLKYYVPVKHELTQAHGAGFNYWDSLFIRKDLI